MNVTLLVNTAKKKKPDGVRRFSAVEEGPCEPKVCLPLIQEPRLGYIWLHSHQVNCFSDTTSSYSSGFHLVKPFLETWWLGDWSCRALGSAAWSEWTWCPEQCVFWPWCSVTSQKDTAHSIPVWTLVWGSYETRTMGIHQKSISNAPYSNTCKQWVAYISKMAALCSHYTHGLWAVGNHRSTDTVLGAIWLPTGRFEKRPWAAMTQGRILLGNRQHISVLSDNALICAALCSLGFVWNPLNLRIPHSYGSWEWHYTYWRNRSRKIKVNDSYKMINDFMLLLLKITKISSKRHWKLL